VTRYAIYNRHRGTYRTSTVRETHVQGQALLMDLEDLKTHLKILPVNSYDVVMVYNLTLERKVPGASLDVEEL
jgi:hypothetical protein